MSRLLFFDLETTHVLHYRGCIHQLAGMVVIDDVVQERFSFNIKPHEKAEIDPESLKIAGVTEDQIQAYPHRTTQFKALIEILKKYVDPYKPETRFFLAGFNNSWFDNEFLRNFFTLEGDDGFSSWFWGNSLDVMVLASQYLLPVRHEMPSFKLKRVASYLGLTVDDSLLHESIYDCELTYGIYKIVRGKTIEDW